MRHGKKINHLSRTHSHRKALMMNMSVSLIMKKRISTTLAKAKALRTFIEPLLTKSKTDSTHSRRMAFSVLSDKDAVTELFKEVSVKIADRPGGYTRILKTGNRPGDAAEMCMIELVDYNESMLGTTKAKAATKVVKTRRGAAKKKPAVAKAAPAVDTASEATETPESAS